MEHNLHELKSTLSDQGIFFCFSGLVSQKLLTDIGVILGQKMEMEKASRTTVSRVFALVVEKMQNIIHYSDEKALLEESIDLEKGLSFGIIAVGYKDDHYFVLSGNLVENHKIDRLREKLTRIQQMTKDELKQYYRERRRQQSDEGSRGAGLGFLEMAKKANLPIEFEFREVDKNMSFFSIKTTI